MKEELFSEVIRTIRELCGESRLEPNRVTRLLERRLQQTSEDEYRTCYELIGGVAIPFRRAELRWMKKRPGGHLYVEIAAELRILSEEIIPELRAFPRWTPILPDPRDLAPKLSLAYQVPAGELHLVLDHNCLEAFSVSQFPVVAWE